MFAHTHTHALMYPFPVVLTLRLVKHSESLCKLINHLVVVNDIFQVVTFWEGEIVDTKNYTFYTGKWEAAYALSFFLSFFFPF